MDGILIIDKPGGITSHDVVARARRILTTKRVGHTGTLDPFATGVMVVLVGQATRLAQFLDKDEKEYEALVQFGSETDTGDRTGVRSADCGLRNEELEEHLEGIDWQEVFEKFQGELMQVPPMYSAKKIEGKKLYELARKGENVERSPVKISIRKLELLGVSLEGRTIKFGVSCSAGTYVRTLAEDIARAAGTRAHLIELRRTRSGRFGMEKAISLDALELSAEPASMLIDMNQAVEHLAAFELDRDRAEKSRSGLSTRVFNRTFAGGEYVRMIGPDGELAAIGRYDTEENSVQPKIVLS